MSDDNKRPVGRPSIYTEELADTICTRLAEGESLRSICRDEAMPAMSSVLLWVVDGRHKEFSAQYARARQAQGYYYADAMLEVASLVGREELSPQAAKVIIDTYKWTAERNAPKAYGAKAGEEEVRDDKPVEVIIRRAVKPDGNR